MFKNKEYGSYHPFDEIEIPLPNNLNKVWDIASRVFRSESSLLTVTVATTFGNVIVYKDKTFKIA